MKREMICRVITGPTASGKSELSMRIARKHGWEILCMDSMQIYRGMDIGTAKPTAEERRLVPHHLLDICDPRDSYSVSGYVEDAEKKIEELHQQGKNILFVGGTGLYLLAMMQPMGLGNVPADEQLRNELKTLAEQPDGRRLLDERLRRTDPDTADRLPLNDIRRRIRAIEVSETTGIPFSRQPERASFSPFRWKTLCLDMDRQQLYQRIHQRVDRMLELGLAEEVRGLLESGVPEDAQSMSAIGYKEMIPYLHGEIGCAEAADLIKLRSRHYAKRQMTFFRRIPNITYLDAEDDALFRKAESFLNQEDEENE